MPQIDKTFTELVQLHERKWGTTDYPGRPSLEQLLNNHIVAMWIIGKRFIFSAHNEVQELNDLLFNLTTGRTEDPLNRKLGKIFINRESVDLRLQIVTVPKEVRSTNQVVTVIHHDPEVISPPNQPKLAPLPPQPNKKYGQALPGRHVHMLPGRKVRILKGHSDPDQK